MKISDVKKLDMGVSGIRIEGNVTYANPPRNVTGEGKQGHYDFWSQFIRVDDGSDGLGCSISRKKDEDGFEVGDHVSVLGKLAEYKNKRDGSIQQILNGQVVKNKEEKKEAVKKTTNGKEDQNLWIAREVAIKAAVELLVAKEIEKEDFYPWISDLVKVISGEDETEAKKEEPVKETKVEKERSYEDLLPEDMPA